MMPSRADFADILPAEAIVDDPQIIVGHLHDWRGRDPGHTPLMLRPRSTPQVQAIVQRCRVHGWAITLQGGNTGLVGGQIPRGEVLVSLRGLAAIRHLDAQTGVMVVEAGVCLAKVQQAAVAAGWRFPLDLASRDSATIGGLIASNAGGVQVLRFGMMRQQVLGLEAVLPDASLWSALSPLYKNNTGPDLMQLLLGAEGTLGAVTAATLRLVPLPGSTATAMAACADVPSALALLRHMQRHCGAGLEAFEAMAGTAVSLSLEHGGHRSPFAAAHPWLVLLEVTDAGAGAHHRVQMALSAALDSGLCADVVLAQSDAQRASMWRLRDDISAAQKHAGASLKHDISLPLAALEDFLGAILPKLQTICPGCRPVVFGHLGDGNLHFNISQPQGADAATFMALADAVAELVYADVVARGGSISAEHGIGTVKRDWAERFLPAAHIAAQRAIRHALDPQRMFNPRVLF